MGGEVALALEVVRGINLVLTYLDEREVSNGALVEAVIFARQEGRQFGLEDLRELVADRTNAVAELDAEIARRTGI